MKVSAKTVAMTCIHALAAILMTGAMWMATAQPVAATQQFATQTGQPCAACHQNPKGGGALTPTGDQFKANGNKMPAKTDAPAPK